MVNGNERALGSVEVVGASPPVDFINLAIMKVHLHLDEVIAHGVLELIHFW